MKRLIILMLFPVSLSAQARSGFAPFVARSDAMPATQWLAGVGISTGYGPLAVRMSAGGGPLRTDDADSPVGLALMADSDVAIVWSEVAALLGWPAMLAPAPFAGVGVHAVQLPGEQIQPVSSWSAGGLLTLPLASFLAVEGEARWRRALEHALLASGRREAWEYRLGIAFRFGAGGGTRSLTGSSRRVGSGSVPKVSIPPTTRADLRPARRRVTITSPLPVSAGGPGVRRNGTPVGGTIT